MKTFKDFIKSDTRTFINPSEFGEPALINGVLAVVVLDDEELERRNLSKQSNTDTDRLSKSEVLFYIERTFFGHIPQANKIMNFNEKKYRIDTVAEQLGILTIELSRFTG
ncbi:hypothetical protein [Sporosarcina sp. FSL K6-5500]|uniref:hypothetical protein n=1 Tax=Sporosarcina sp. FSL K6-5500 TaxID=2921558 RepID=UPI0030FB0FAC